MLSLEITSSQIIRPSGLAQSKRRSAMMAWRAGRAPPKRGRRRAAAPPLGPAWARVGRARDDAFRARGQGHVRILLGEDVVHGEQDLAMSADGEALHRR